MTNKRFFGCKHSKGKETLSQGIFIQDETSNPDQRSDGICIWAGPNRRPVRVCTPSKTCVVITYPNEWANLRKGRGEPTGWGRMARNGREMNGAEIAKLVHFPAVWSSRDLVYMIDALDGLTKSNRLGFKSGFYKGAILIDSDYQKFQVVGARKVKTIIHPNFDHIFALFTGNPYWQVEFIFGRTPKKSSLDEVKQLIFKSFRMDKHIWEEMMDFEEFRDKIAAALSVEAIGKIFKEFHQA